MHLKVLPRYEMTCSGYQRQDVFMLGNISFALKRNPGKNNRKEKPVNTGELVFVTVGGHGVNFY